MPTRRGDGLAPAGRHELCFLGTAAAILQDLLRGRQLGQGRRQRPRHQRAALPHHQQGRPGPAARRARGHRLRHLPRVRPPGARRHGSGPDDQLRGRARGKGLSSRVGSSQRRLAAQHSASMRGAAAVAARCPSWQHELTGAMFPDAYNPFGLASVPGDWSWLDTKKVDMGPYFRRRGLVFVDGKPLEPVEQSRELGNTPLRSPIPTPRSPTNPPAATGCPLARAGERSCRKSAARRMPGSGWKTRETPFTSACPPTPPPSP